MTLDTYETFFKSSARSAGLRLFKEAKVSFTKPSILEINAYVKPNYRLVLKLESIQSPNLTVNCNCPQFKKAELCKHIWATFLAVSKKSPDFFDAINEIIKKPAEVKKTNPKSEAQINSDTAYKLKQDNFRKEQYQKQKARAKEFKTKQKKSFKIEMPIFPNDVQEALNYFLQNGFSFENSLNKDSVFFARKKLARIFHPDVGGSHDESLELNAKSEILLKYISKIT